MLSNYPSEFILNCIPTAVIVAIISYLIGSVNFSIIISKAISGNDIRKSGSGNAGATNMLRTYGKKMAIVVLFLDILKGILCVGLAKLYIFYLNNILVTPDVYTAILTSMSLPYIAGLFVILGHSFPIYFGFKGGKGVATSLGVVMMLDWKIGVVVLIIALAIMAISRYVSLGSVVSAALFVILEISRMFSDNSWNIIKLICVILMGVLVISRHHANIARLINGTENKLGKKKNTDISVNAEEN